MGVIKGCEFLKEKVPGDIFTSEDFTEEHRMFKETADKFMKEEVLPRNEEIEEKKTDVLVSLVKKAGELGFFAVDIPEEYGGTGGDKVSALLVNEAISIQGSFATTCEAHITIGTHPLVFFGSEELKKKYLPDLAWARKIGAYALTEPTAGSDALNIKTKATFDGKHYILEGTKQFITNAGFADTFIVFAKVDGKHFSAFLVERGWEGLSLGPEEEKMGIKGSSTTQVILEGVKVPKENLIGEVGKGHYVALNALNLGRMRLGCSCVGIAKYAINECITYALDRKQFGKPIANYGLIKQKLATMAAKTFALESAAYRITASIDELWLKQGVEEWKAFEEYAVEAAMLKVGGSEAYDQIIDEGVQIYGGYGYIKEYPMERLYRDSRINRIFEGTNEINRLNIPEMILRRAMRGRIDFFGWLKQAGEDLQTPDNVKKKVGDITLAEELFALEIAKRILLVISGKAYEKFMEKFVDEQEILGAFSDVCIGVYFGESAIARVNKNKSDPRVEQMKDMTQFYIRLIMPSTISSLRLIAARVGFERGYKMIESLSTLLAPIDMVSLSRRITDRMLKEGKYIPLL